MALMVGPGYGEQELENMLQWSRTGMILCFIVEMVNFGHFLTIEDSPCGVVLAGLESVPVLLRLGDL